MTQPPRREPDDDVTALLDRVGSVYGFWGRHSLLYAAQDYVTFLGRPKRIRVAAVAALGLRRGAVVLEVACGSGRNLPYLVHAVGPGGKVVGFDYTPEMLAAAQSLCRRRGWSKVECIQGDAAELDVGDAQFDGVVSVLGISAVPRWRLALERCHRVLRPGGVLAVCDARLFAGAWSVLNPALRKLYERGAAWDPTRDIPGEIRRIFGNATVEDFNAGTFFVARAVKSENADG